MRLALAMVMAYGVALSMDWQKPFWAGLSVTVLSLDSAGQSVLKIILRTVGTLAAAVVALSLIALFPQERWWFFLSLSLVEGFCCYRMLGSPYPYAWMVSGFVAAIIAIDGGPPDGLRDFNVAMERLQETGTGILAYTFSGFLIPTGSTGGSFKSNIMAMSQRLGSLLESCLAPYGGKSTGDSQTAKDLRQLDAEAATLESLVAPVALESGSIWMERRRWHHVALGFRALPRVLNHVRLAGLGLAERERLLLEPSVSLLHKGVDQRFAAMGEAMAGQSPGSPPPSSPLLRAISPERMDCSMEERAHLQASWRPLQHLDELSARLWGLMNPLPSGHGEACSPALRPHLYVRLAMIDPDHLWLASRLMAQIWIAVLLWIYLPGLPIGLTIISLMPSIGLTMAQTPMLRGQTLVAPALQALLATGVVYVFVLPRLDGFFGLASVLAMASFAIGTYYYKNAPMRTLTLCLFIVACSIRNQQTYNFINFLNLSIAVFVAFAIAAFSQDLPVSWLPERQALRLLRRLMCSTNAIVELTMHTVHTPLRWPNRMRLAFYRKAARNIPAKLASLAAKLPLQMLKSNKDQVDELVNAVQSVSLWLDDWSEAPPQLNAPSFNLPSTSLPEFRESLEDGVLPSTPFHLESALQAVKVINEGCLSHLKGVPAGQATGHEMDRLTLWLGCGFRLESAMRELQGIAGWFEWERWRQSRFC
ncbi:FUSC family protein [Synechococcus sp. CCY9201]|uniref:FUSC family protein n=1 Tax=Synechococcus sp. CCY9201 TaxID=174697 RepID=UPI002B215711|nr:FUSC family protein [Synechococcus sp. CCY9201]MEA5474089.1 FUSC family protein [Synechococcus sp. CCY9201]